MAVGPGQTHDWINEPVQALYGGFERSGLHGENAKQIPYFRSLSFCGNDTFLAGIGGKCEFAPPGKASCQIRVSGHSRVKLNSPHAAPKTKVSYAQEV